MKYEPDYYKPKNNKIVIGIVVFMILGMLFSGLGLLSMIGAF